MRWTAEGSTAMGVTERPFVVERAGDTIPGILWSPEASAGPSPLVLVGHGGHGEKRNRNGLAMARRLVRRLGYAVAAIDAIDHGERGPIRPPDHRAYRALWHKPDTFDRMSADWQATLDALSDLPSIDSGRVAYWGLSMGTMFGVPLVAAEPRIKVAVLGLCGFTGPSADRGRIATRHAAEAPRITCPVLFFVQWHDERFYRQGAFDLFDQVGSKDKRLHAHPGAHGELPAAEATDATIAFLRPRFSSAQEA
jgi:dienelactone hydrolase